ncbi:hypothetical protein [Duganella sp. LjRoot269]|uniref:hypothetical protein n=1 Tax=Duganella sp. LjRoot269 TaxID=3342305 RepID=UPI003ECDD0F0
MEQENNAGEGGAPQASSTIGGNAPVIERKAVWDPKGRRNMIIIGSVILSAIVLVVLMSVFGGPKEAGKASSITPSKDEQPVGTGMMSTTERATLQAQEQARLADAQAKGQSALGNDMAQSGVTLGHGQGQVSNNNGAPAAGVANGEVPRRGEQRLDQQQGASSQASGEAGRAADAKVGQLATQMDFMMQAWGLKAAGQQDGGAKTMSRYSRSMGTQNAAQPGQQVAANGAGQAAQAGHDPSEVPVIGAYQQAYGAETMGPIDTDTPGKLRSKILSGPFAGGVATGTAKRIGTQGVQFDFDTVYFNGRPIKVSAYGVDLATSGDVVQGNYDGRYIQRFVFPILSEGLRAYATARAQTGTQVIAINLPGSSGLATGAQQTPPPTAEQAREAMIAAGANQVTQILRTGPQDGHITLDVRQPFAIVFEQPVYQSDLIGQTTKTSK